VKGALQKTLSMIISGSNTRVGRPVGRKLGNGDVRCKKMGVNVVNGRGRKGSSGVIVGWEAAASFMAADVKSGSGSFASDKGSTETRKHAKVFDDRHAMDGVDSHVLTKAKIITDRTAVVVNAWWGFITDDSSELPCKDWMPNCTAKLDRFEGIRIIKTLEHW
jgi:hypothetical protein